MMVECSEWTQYGRNFLGYRKAREVEALLRKRSVDAQIVLKNTGCDHLVYGAKYYEGNGDLREVCFYMKPMNDAEYDAVSRMRDVLVYALHNRK